nr:hypothetical protein Q903MT_gene1687 [Picea sitchensis]
MEVGLLNPTLLLPFGRITPHASAPVRSHKKERASHMVPFQSKYPVTHARWIYYEIRGYALNIDINNLRWKESEAVLPFIELPETVNLTRSISPSFKGLGHLHFKGTGARAGTREPPFIHIL